VDWHALRRSLILEFIVLLLAKYFACYLRISLSTKFRGLMELMKTTKFCFQPIKIDSHDADELQKTIVTIRSRNKERHKYTLGSVAVESVTPLQLTILKIFRLLFTHFVKHQISWSDGTDENHEILFSANKN
jgi:hypothetical protein